MFGRKLPGGRRKEGIGGRGGSFGDWRFGRRWGHLRQRRARGVSPWRRSLCRWGCLWSLFCRRCLGFVVDVADNLLHRHGLTLGDGDGQHTGDRGGDLDGRLVRFQLKQWFVGLDEVAGALVPDRQKPLRDRLARTGDLDFDRHDRSLANPRFMSSPRLAFLLGAGPSLSAVAVRCPGAPAPGGAAGR